MGYLGYSETEKIREIFRIGNFVGCTIATTLITAGAFVNMFYICPALYGFYGCRWMIFLGFVLYFQVMTNYVLVRFTYRRNEASRWAEQVELPEKTKDSFRLCPVCNKGRPKRSYHCVSCNICCLRCDHHCFLTSACIGIANHGYFIVWLLWVSIGICYASLYMYEYVNQFAVRSEYLGIFGYFFPIAVIRAFFGYESCATAFILTLLGIGLHVGTMATGLFVMQMFYLLKGFTFYEYHFLRQNPKKKVNGDGGTTTERLEMIFGRPWYRSFIFPRPFRSTRLTPEIIANLFNDGQEDKEI